MLTAGTRLEAWRLAALRELLHEDAVEPVLVIEADSPPRHAGASVDRPAGPSLPANPLAMVSAASELEGLVRVGRAQACGAAAAGAVDVIWATDAREVPADLAAAAAAGVWGLDVADGDPSCVGPLLRGTPRIRARLLRFAAAPGRAQVLAEAYFRSEAFAPALTRARALYGCARLPARQARAWRLRGEAALRGEEVTVPPARVPRALERLALPARQCVSLLGRAWSSCFRDQWAIGISERPLSDFLSGTRSAAIHWFPEATGGNFHADPFGIDTREGLVVLAEGYDARRRTGRIDVLRPGVDGSLAVERDVLAQSGHLSYPYLIPHGDDVYCVPEMHEQRRIDLYRGEPFPHRWRRMGTLVEDFAGVDPTIFRHEGRWWLLCANQDDEPYANLYGFFADVLTGPWRAHPLNPLKCDPSSARPAGTPFSHEGALYRPAQDCSIGYGGAVVINRVVALSPAEFLEVPQARIKPDPTGPYPDGLHTVAAVGERTVVDGMRWVFSFGAALRAGRHFLQRLQNYHAGARQAPSAGAAGSADPGG